MHRKRPENDDPLLRDIDRQLQAGPVRVRRIADPLVDDLIPKDHDDEDEPDGEKALGDYHAPVPPHVVPATYRRPAHLVAPTPPSIEGAPRATGQPQKPKRLPASSSRYP